MVRRLPIYVLADCSGSMEGEAIEAVKQGIACLQQNVMNDPLALDSAYLSIITFDDTAQQIVPLTDILHFEAPELVAGGMTALGAALTLLTERIDVEVRRTGPSVKGDWRPLVFLLTDGAPSDEWHAPAARLRALNLGNIIALACGSETDLTALEQLTANVYQMHDMNTHSFAQFFRWISSTVTLASQGRITEMPRGRLNIPPPPQGIEAVIV